MLARLRSRMSYANVMSTIAVFVALGTGGAYAANTVGSSDIIDNSVASVDLNDGDIKAVDIGVGQVLGSRIVDGTVKTEDLADNRVASADLKDGDVRTIDLQDDSVTSAKVLDDTVAGGGLGAADIATDGVGALEVANNSIDSGEIVDFQLSNQDVGVLFAQVNANGTLANSSGGGITSAKVGGVGSGTYEVDFARSMSACAFVVTQGDAGDGDAGGAITAVADRTGNLEAAFVAIRNHADAVVDRPFQLIAVC